MWVAHHVPTFFADCFHIFSSPVALSPAPATPGPRWPSWSAPRVTGRAGTRRRRGTGEHRWIYRTLWRNSTMPSRMLGSRITWSWTSCLLFMTSMEQAMRKIEWSNQITALLLYKYLHTSHVYTVILQHSILFLFFLSDMKEVKINTKYIYYCFNIKYPVFLLWL